MTETPLTPHARHNRTAWDRRADRYQARHGEQLVGAAWGMWQIPEEELRILGDVAGRDVLELGCGAAQWSIELHRRGARVTGLDVSARQLHHARRNLCDAGVELPLVHASAEAVPLADASFDVVFCDHGAMSFADPERTVPEAARLLRPGGLLAFCMLTPIAELTWPGDADEPGDRLVRDYFDLRATDDRETIGFNLPYGAWIRLFRAHGLAIEDLVELRPPADGESTYRNEDGHAWARRWPIEHVWKVRREG